MCKMYAVIVGILFFTVCLEGTTLTEDFEQAVSKERSGQVESGLKNNISEILSLASSKVFPGDPVARKRIKEKLCNIVIKRIEFDNMPVKSVINFLRQCSFTQDQAGKGVNFVLKLDEKSNQEISVTIDEKDISLIDAVKLVCLISNLKFQIDNYAVIIASQDADLNHLETRIYPIGQGVFNKISKGEGGQEMKRFFLSHGISFPSGANIIQESKNLCLIVTNTQENLNKIEVLLKDLAKKVPQVRIETKLVRVKKEDLDLVAGEVLQYNQDKLWNSKKVDVIATSSLLCVNGAEASVNMYTQKSFPEKWLDSIEDEKTGKVIKGCFPVFDKPEDLGILLTVSPKVNKDSKMIQLDLNVALKALCGFTEYKHKTALGDHIAVKKPIINAAHSATNIKLKNRQTVSYDIMRACTKKNGKDGSGKTVMLIRAELINHNGQPVKKQEYQYNCRKTDADNRIPATCKLSLRNALMKPIDCDFENVKLNDIVNYLNSTAENLNLNLSVNSDSLSTLTLSLKATPVLDVIRYIAWLSNLRYQVAESHVILKNSESLKMKRKSFELKKRFLWLIAPPEDEQGINEKSLKEYFSARNVPFPEGSTIAYDREKEKLVVRNTPANLDTLDALLKVIGPNQPLVLFESKFIEISDNDLQEFLSKADDSEDPYNSMLALSASKVGDCLSAPKVISTSGSTAVIRMVREEYFPEKWNFSKDIGCPLPELGESTGIGCRYSVTPTVSLDKLIYLQLEPEVASLAGWTMYPYSPRKKGDKQVKMPIVERLRVNTDIQVHDGTSLLLGHFQFKKAPNDKIFFFGAELFSKLIEGVTVNEKLETRHLLNFITVRLVDFDGKPIE